MLHKIKHTLEEITILAFSVIAISGAAFFAGIGASVFVDVQSTTASLTMPVPAMQLKLAAADMIGAPLKVDLVKKSREQIYATLFPKTTKSARVRPKIAEYKSDVVVCTERDNAVGLAEVFANANVDYLKYAEAYDMYWSLAGCSFTRNISFNLNAPSFESYGENKSFVTVFPEVKNGKVTDEDSERRYVIFMSEEIEENIFRCNRSGSSEKNSFDHTLKCKSST